MKPEIKQLHFDHPLINTYWFNEKDGYYHWIYAVQIIQGKNYLRSDRITINEEEHHLQHDIGFTVGFDDERSVQIDQGRYDTAYSTVRDFYWKKYEQMKHVKMPSTGSVYIDSHNLTTAVQGAQKYFIFYLNDSKVKRLIKVVPDDHNNYDQFRCLYTHFCLDCKNDDEYFVMIYPEKDVYLKNPSLKEIVQIGEKIPVYSIGSMTGNTLYPITEEVYDYLILEIKRL